MTGEAENLIPPTQRRPIRSILKFAFVSILLLAAGIGVYIAAYRYGLRPAPERRAIFQGVEYIREVFDQPYPSVVHLVIADLDAPGVKVHVTPPDFPGEKLPLKARTTSGYLREFGLQAAVNANNFMPFRTWPLWEFYPWPGDRVTVAGGAASAGSSYGDRSPLWPVLNFDVGGRPGIRMAGNDPWFNAIVGVKWIIKNGQSLAMNPGNDPPRVRTAAGIDATGRRLMMAVADGDLPPYAVGIRRSDFTALLVRHGVHNAIELDAGGSSSLVLQIPGGGSKLMNVPVQAGVPGFERPVGNHLGLFAQPLR